MHHICVGAHDAKEGHDCCTDGGEQDGRRCRSGQVGDGGNVVELAALDGGGRRNQPDDAQEQQSHPDAGWHWGCGGLGLGKEQEV